jgi:hypothetical protein
MEAKEERFLFFERLVPKLFLDGGSSGMAD